MQKKKTKKIKILQIACAAFVVYAIVSFTVMQVDINNRRETLALAQQELVEQNYLRDEVTSILNSGANIDYITRVAREKLGFAFPNERVIIDYKRK